MTDDSFSLLTVKPSVVQGGDLCPYTGSIDDKFTMALTAREKAILDITWVTIIKDTWIL